MKTNNQTFKLIDGVFNSKDAKEILLSIIDNKINFHSHRVFSKDIRFGTLDDFSANRIQELKQARAEIVDLIQDSEEKNTQMILHSNISIEFK
ncbi:MAG TPA: hypothetical protein PLU17_04865 [Chitinophagaceae bacterium]|nr:hypothetical protein [Chitinophagaceae bacterium]